MLRTTDVEDHMKNVCVDSFEINLLVVLRQDITGLNLGSILLPLDPKCRDCRLATIIFLEDSNMF